MDEITIMRIREINSRILTQEAKIINATNQLKELKSQLKKLKEDK